MFTKLQQGDVNVENFDVIGVNYDCSRRADIRIVGKFAELLQIEMTDRCLEVGSGTGNYTLSLSEMGYKMTGVDPSSTMANVAIKKDTNRQVTWVKGCAECLPFHDNVFSGVFCMHVVHHFDKRLVAFKEIFRVMNKGRFVIFTNSHEQINNYWLKHYFPKVIQKTINRTPDTSVIKSLLQSAGFKVIKVEKYHIPDDLEDGFLGSNKVNPHRYIDHCFRTGISAFWDMSDREIASGVKRLEEDVSTGKVHEIIKNYENNLGEYLFVVCEKKLL